MLSSKKLNADFNLDRFHTGKIIDETRETITIFSDGKAKMVSKRPGKFMFENGELNGNKIAYRSQDRIKKVKA